MTKLNELEKNYVKIMIYYFQKRKISQFFFTLLEKRIFLKNKIIAVKNNFKIEKLDFQLIFKRDHASSFPIFTL
jgi:hypothetical protein